jgi:hypothetical protein
LRFPPSAHIVPTHTMSEMRCAAAHTRSEPMLPRILVPTLPTP